MFLLDQVKNYQARIRSPAKKWSKILREAAKKGYNFSCRATKTAAGGGGGGKGLTTNEKNFFAASLTP